MAAREQRRPSASRVGSAKSMALGALGAVAIALPSLLWLAGFTVDDALISARVAHHLAIGVGYRMSSGGPVVDAVTPFGYAWVLAPFARAGVLSTLSAAKGLGAGCWLAAVAILGGATARLGGARLRFAPLALLGACTPLAAWASSGMETGIVLLLATLALGSGSFAALCAGVAAAWRPELLPWALVLRVGLAWGAPRRMAGHAALLLVPVALVVCARASLFGATFPLSALAKPSDLAHGLRYALGAVLLTGPPLLVIARPRQLPLRERAMLLAAGVHFVSLLLAGGDWMPLYRLATPVLPSLVWIGVVLARAARPWATAVRVGAALVPCALIAIYIGPSAAAVGAHRRALIEAARPELAGYRRIAALDVGWVGAASSASIVDLAGVTDPTVARLSGSHTDKHLPAGFVRAREVDAVVLLLAPGEPAAPPWPERMQRTVDARAAAQAAALGFERAAVLPLGGTTQSYVVLAAPRP